MSFSSTPEFTVEEKFSKHRKSRIQKGLYITISLVFVNTLLTNVEKDDLLWLINPNKLSPLAPFKAIALASLLSEAPSDRQQAEPYSRESRVVETVRDDMSASSRDILDGLPLPNEDLSTPQIALFYENMKNDPLFAEAILHPSTGERSKLAILLEDIHGSPHIQLNQIIALKKLGINCVGLEGWTGTNTDGFNAESTLVEVLTSHSGKKDLPSCLIPLEDPALRRSSFAIALALHIVNYYKPTLYDEITDPETDKRNFLRQVHSDISKYFPEKRWKPKRVDRTVLVNEMLADHSLNGVFEEGMTFESLKRRPNEDIASYVSRLEAYEKKLKELMTSTIVEARSQKGVSMLVTAMTDQHLSTTALLFGAAHSNGIREALIQSGFSVIVVPVDADAEEAVDSLDALMNLKAFEEIIKGLD